MTFVIASARVRVRVLKTIVKVFTPRRMRMSGKNIGLLATYGTLRDDDDSGAAWTKDFLRVCSH